jgi:hypothetical protein
MPRSGRRAMVTAELTYTWKAYQNNNDDQTGMNVRPGTSKTGEAGRIPKGRRRSITVIRWLDGDPVT